MSTSLKQKETGKLCAVLSSQGPASQATILAKLQVVVTRKQTSRFYQQGCHVGEIAHGSNRRLISNYQPIELVQTITRYIDRVLQLSL